MCHSCKNWSDKKFSLCGPNSLYRRMSVAPGANGFHIRICGWEQPCWKEPGSWWAKKLQVIQHGSSRGETCPELIQGGTASRDRDGTIPFQSALARSHLEHFVLFLSPQFKKDRDRLERAQRSENYIRIFLYSENSHSLGQPPQRLSTLSG